MSDVELAISLAPYVDYQGYIDKCNEALDRVLENLENSMEGVTQWHS